MQFRQSGQGDERRRRVFRDEMIAAPNSDSDPTDDPKKARDEADGRVYPDAASAQRQSSLTSLLPQRALTLVLLFLGGGLAIAGIELLYARLFVGLPEPFQVSLAVFDLTGRGNIADWFASLTLVAGAVTSMLVYLIRRHRIDDYRGRYRMWQWATACFMIGSFDAATGANAIFVPAMIQLTGTKLLGDGSVWSVMLVGLAVAACLVRLAIEIRSSRLATTFLCLAAGSYIGFAVTSFHPALNAAELARVIASSATLLAGHFCLLYCVALYGRHVYQEAQGTRRASRTKPVVASPSEPKKPRATSRRRAETVGSKSVRIDSAHEKPAATETAPATVPTISKKTVQKTVSATVAQKPTDSDRAISKAERRRLRKLDRREQRQGDEEDE
ncbi:MAG: hypothetical protein ABI614_23135 [Planctomycetota bacterium]